MDALAVPREPFRHWRLGSPSGSSARNRQKLRRSFLPERLRQPAGSTRAPISRTVSPVHCRLASLPPPQDSPNQQTRPRASEAGPTPTEEQAWEANGRGTHGAGVLLPRGTLGHGVADRDVPGFDRAESAEVKGDMSRGRRSRRVEAAELAGQAGRELANEDLQLAQKEARRSTTQIRSHLQGPIDFIKIRGNSSSTLGGAVAPPNGTQWPSAGAPGVTPKAAKVAQADAMFLRDEEEPDVQQSARRGRRRESQAPSDSLASEDEGEGEVAAKVARSRRRAAGSGGLADGSSSEDEDERVRVFAAAKATENAADVSLFEADLEGGGRVKATRSQRRVPKNRTQEAGAISEDEGERERSSAVGKVGRNVADGSVSEDEGDANGGARGADVAAGWSPRDEGMAVGERSQRPELEEDDALQLSRMIKSAVLPRSSQSESANGMPSVIQPGTEAGSSSSGSSSASAKGSPDGFKVDPSTLAPGDHVVHIKLGVCRFIGTRTEVPQGRDKKVKYLLLKFADGTAKLSSKQAKQVLYRYGLNGTSGRPPSLSKLNDTAGWEKKKSKGEAAVKRMVMDMMELYIHRLRLRRPVYPKFTAEMEQFAAGFPYKPTPDQVQAFQDIERDMTERETPMDRLICGDVGFGKTEVALRAIFRAVLDGRQVMVLAPTTVLAKQHFNVISARFAKYSQFRVGLLSRFQKEAERREVLEQIKSGSMHIVAGTHALLGSQVVYHNLGLLVIDEEQRFGVRQKERISSLKTTVDLLTLSATPIPRTLYMSLHGFRDASRISTPPPERRPITTHVLEYSEDVVVEAITRELNRNGQIFYVRPRVEGMEAYLYHLQILFPDVPMDVAHGQMKPTELEEKMERFCGGETRLLLCTTIIESGIDIRTANTIIIEDAHLFGLAQVYQLRGRVGRSDAEAHAYLLHPSYETLSAEAQERLTALKTHGGLGQGYELAQRDMDIRGIGDVFGERQSGDVGGVGYYLFMEMLKNTLNKVEQESLPRVYYDDVRLELCGEFEKIPVDYVRDERARERLQDEAEDAARQGMQSLLQLCNRVRKEFGEETPAMEMTLKTLFLKRIATDLGIERIFMREGTSTVLMATAMKLPAFEKLVNAIGDEELKSSLSFHAGRIELACRQQLSETNVLNRTLACLGQMRNALPSFVNFL